MLYVYFGVCFWHTFPNKASINLRYQKFPQKPVPKRIYFTTMQKIIVKLNLQFVSESGSLLNSFLLKFYQRTITKKSGSPSHFSRTDISEHSPQTNNPYQMPEKQFLQSYCTSTSNILHQQFVQNSMKQTAIFQLV